MDDNLVDKIKGLLTEIRGALRNEDPQGWEREREAVRAAHESLRTKHEEAIREQREIIDKAEAAAARECREPGDEPAIGDQRTGRADVDGAPPDSTPPGEPVEPGGLRAGDRVAFTWEDERITGTLVSDPNGPSLRSDTPDSNGYRPHVTSGDEWVSGVYDVRLIERAPREEGAPAGDPDEVLAEALRKAHTTGDWLDVARASREHFHANEGYEYDLLMRDRNMRPSQRGEG